MSVTRQFSAMLPKITLGYPREIIPIIDNYATCKICYNFGYTTFREMFCCISIGFIFKLNIFFYSPRFFCGYSLSYYAMIYAWFLQLLHISKYLFVFLSLKFCDCWTFRFFLSQYSWRNKTKTWIMWKGEFYSINKMLIWKPTNKILFNTQLNLIRMFFVQKMYVMQLRSSTCA